MSRDGSGVYSKVGASVAVTSTTIASNPYNNQIDDLAAAVNDTVLLSGIKPFTGPQSMGSQKITSLASGTAATDAANVGQVQNSIISHSVSVGGTVDAITAVHAPVMTTWTAMTGFRGMFTATGANTSTAPTFNPDGIGVKTLVKLNNLPLVAGDIIGAGHEVEWEYNGTNVVILNPARIGNSTVSMVSKAINQTKGAAVASAATMDIWTPADGNLIHGTGTATVTSFGTAPQAGAERWIVADAAFTVTNNANITIGGGTRTLAVGDILRVVADTTTVALVTIFKGDGTAVAGGSAPKAHITVLTSGTSWTSNAAHKWAEVVVIGGGGSNGAGSGGGAAKKIYTLTPSTAYTYAVGAAASGAGIAGTSTFSDGTTTISATGGRNTAVGGVGSNGDLNLNGSSYSLNGTFPTFIGGMSGGGYGTGGDGTTAPTYGGGAGGVNNTQAGAAGAVIITEYY